MISRVKHYQLIHLCHTNLRELLSIAFHPITKRERKVIYIYLRRLRGLEIIDRRFSYG